MEKSGENTYTTLYRQLDTQQQRWWSVDPVTQPWQSPYTAMDNNPISLNDPDGDCPICPFLIAAGKGALEEYITQITTNKLAGKTWKEAFISEIDIADIGVAAIASASTLGLDTYVKAPKTLSRLKNALEVATEVSKSSVDVKYDEEEIVKKESIFDFSKKGKSWVDAGVDIAAGPGGGLVGNKVGKTAEYFFYEMSSTVGKTNKQLISIERKLPKLAKGKPAYNKALQAKTKANGMLEDIRQESNIKGKAINTVSNAGVGATGEFIKNTSMAKTIKDREQKFKGKFYNRGGVER